MTGGPARWRRVAVAILAGLAAAWFTNAMLSQWPHLLAGDFTYPWRAARILLQHHDPYQVIQPTGRYPFSDPFNYPLPAAIVALPVSWLPPRLACALFSGISVVFFTYCITSEGWFRLPVLASFSVLTAIQGGQWSPLLTAAMLMPSLGWLGAAKPNLAIAGFAYRPTWRTAIGGSMFVAATLLWIPRWPIEWLHAVRLTGTHVAPISLLGGPLLILAILRWRRPEARLLAALACVPQSMFGYDQLPLFLVARNISQTLWLVIASHVFSIVGALAVPKGAYVHAPPDRFLHDYLATSGPLIVALFYLPCLIMVLRRPNEGEVPPMVVQLGDAMARIRRLAGPGRVVAASARDK